MGGGGRDRMVAGLTTTYAIQGRIQGGGARPLKLEKIWRIQDFKLGGADLKKIAPSGGRRENFGVFRVKNHDFTPKNHIFSNFRGRAPPPRIPPRVA
jgi:hypothetical protein